MVDRIRDLPSSEPYLRLAREGKDVWNQWIRAGMTDEEAQRYDLGTIRHLRGDDLAALASKLNLDLLPNHKRPPNFDGVDFSQEGNDGICFAGFVFAPERGFEEKTRDYDGSIETGSASVLFRHTTFSKMSRFDGATFGDGACFNGSKFGERVALDGGGTINRPARFNGTVFGGGANFGGAVFDGGASFDGAVFGSGASFDATEFHGSAAFNGATFGDGASFSGATFSNSAHFDGWEEQKLRDFQSDLLAPAGTDQQKVASKINARIAMAQPKRFKQISFASATFRGECAFRDRKFERAADFSGAVFRSVPEFAGCEGLGHLDLSRSEEHTSELQSH